MSTIILDECLSELYKAEKCLSEYKELDSYLEIFEAENPEVKDQIVKNQKAKTGAIEHLKNAGKAILKMIREFISNIQDFFAKRKMSEAQRKAYDEFKRAAKNDPNLKNKKITVRDFTKIQKEYTSLLEEAEKMDRDLASGKVTDCSALLNKITDFAGGSAKGIAVSVGCEAALNIASSSTELAQLLLKGLKNDEQIQKAIIESIGEKEAGKFEKDLAALGKRYGLKRAMLRLTGKLSTSVQDGIEKTISQVSDLCTNGVNAAVAMAGKESNIDKNAVQRGVENVKFAAKNAGTFAKAGSSVARNKDLVRRIASNDEIKSGVKGAMQISKDVQDMGTQWYADNRKREFKRKLKNLTTPDMKDQSAFDAILGTNDPNSLYNKRKGIFKKKK